MSNRGAPIFDSRDALARGRSSWLRLGRGRLGALARAALPQCCALCAAPTGDALVCRACAAALPSAAEACPACALPSLGALRCGACVADPPPHASAIAAFVYAFPVDRLLQRLKYGGALAIAPWAAEQLAERVLGRPPAAAAPWPEVLVALPLAAGRQRERGFNQAQEIARSLARAIGVPAAPLLARVRESPPQATLPWAGRAANVRHAFGVRPGARGRHVALIDDVMTTGATLREAARTLLQGGAASVSVWVIARTLPPHEP